MADFKIGEREFRSQKMSAMKQVHVGRKVLPFYGDMMATAYKNGTSEADISAMLDRFKPIANALAEMKDEDAEYIINSCLDVTQIKQGSIWSNMRSNGLLMFQDLEGFDLIKIASYVLQDNFARFFSGSPAE